MTSHHRLIAAAVALAAWCSPAAAQVFKCPGPDGRPVFVDRPCHGDMPKHEAPADRAAVMFTGNHSNDLIRASAMIDNMRVLGRECEWKLKVDRNQAGACRLFLDKTSQAGDLGAVGARLRQITDRSDLTPADASELRRINSMLRDVLRSREFAAASMSSR